MRYQIIYQEGMGINEKNQIREIYDQLPKIDDSINLELLEENYNSLSKLQEVKSLPIISEEDRTIFSQIEKIKEMKDIKFGIEVFLKFNAREINVTIINKVIELSASYNKKYLEIKPYLVKITEFNSKIEDLMKKHGSEASSIADIQKEFGDFGIGTVGTDYSSDNSDGDFM